MSDILKIQGKIYEVIEGRLTKVQFGDVIIPVSGDASVKKELVQTTLDDFTSGVEEEPKKVEAVKEHKLESWLERQKTLGPKVGSLHTVPILKKVVDKMKELSPDREAQSKYIDDVFYDISKHSRKKYFHTYRQWIFEKGIKTAGFSVKKRTPSLGYVNRTPIKEHVLEELRKTPRKSQKAVLSKLFPNIKKTTLRKYLYAYRNWINKHPTTKQIATKLANGRPDTGETITKVGAVYIKDKVFADYKEKPTKETLKKYFPHLSPASLDTYEGCYNKYLRRQKQAEKINANPGDLKLVKSKMVTLWREGLPITKKNLKSMLKDVSNKNLSDILRILIENREAKYNNKDDCYDVLFK